MITAVTLCFLPDYLINDALKYSVSFMRVKDTRTLSFLFVLSLWLTVYSGQRLLHSHQEMFGEPATV